MLERKRQIILVFLLLLIMFSGCAKQEVPENVSRALEHAAENRSDLEKVLNKYNRFKKDSLKFKAACYLIANMPGHQNYFLHNASEYDDEFKAVGRVSEMKRAVWDSLGPGFLNIEISELNLSEDIKSVDYDFLIENIEGAFYAWENYPWCEKVSYEDFETFILPYRSSNEPLIPFRKKFQEKYEWILDSISDKSQMKEAFKLIYNDFVSWFESSTGVKYPIPMNFNQLLLARGGTCNDECNILHAIMKSMGVLSSIDQTKYWANRNSGHSWVAYVDENKERMIINDDNILKKRDFIHSAYFSVDYPYDSLISDKILLYQYKTSAKVIRKTFEPNYNSLNLQKQYNVQIPNGFNDIFDKDVSEKYLKTRNVGLVLDNLDQNEIAFLCIFNIGGLLPVSWASSNNKQYVFQSMGSNVLYIAARFSEGNFLPVSNPFVIDKDRNIKFFNAKNENKQDLHLYRKYPLFGNILNYANYMYGAKFQGSDDPDFEKYEDLFTIKNTPLNITEIIINPEKAYRYYRYIPRDTLYGDVAEIQFYDKTDSKIPLKGNFIFKNEGPATRSVQKAFDNNYNSFYRSSEKNTWIGLDFGANKKYIRKIIFCPRTDTNFILPGNDYELYFWDSGWKSAGIQKAVNQELTFKNIPAGTIYWLHCLTGGKEERPFTYENGKQVWW